MTINIFENVQKYDKELQEIIALYETLPFSDPYKEELYTNINELIEFENELYNPRFRIINGQTPGTTYLSEIGNSATKIQDMFSSAYKKVVGIAENVQNKTLLDKTSILANVKLGSIIFEFEEIGKEKKGQEDLIDINMDKVGLLNELVQDSFLICKDEEYLKGFIGKYGMRSLKNFKDFITELDHNNSYFEYTNSADDIDFIYSKKNIEKVLEIIHDFKPIEHSSDYLIKGFLIGISTENGKLTFRNYNDEKITVNIIDESLKTNKIIVNNYYELLVEKRTIESLESIKDIFECNTINGTMLESINQ